MLAICFPHYCVRCYLIPVVITYRRYRSIAFGTRKEHGRKQEEVDGTKGHVIKMRLPVEFSIGVTETHTVLVRIQYAVGFKTHRVFE
jgi:hypothetical protein